MLRKNQRHFVKYFKNYHIDPDNLTLPPEREPKSVSHLLRHFDPLGDAVDKRILYEIMERKKLADTFSDDASDGGESEESHPTQAFDTALRTSLLNPDYP